jgi:hypothetical protein
MAGGSFKAAFLTAAVVLAGGCDSTISPIEVAPGCPDQPVRGPEQWAGEPATQLIDDFESGDGKLARAEARDGEWLLSKDQTGATSSAGTSSLCVARGQYAGHLVTSASTDWGALWTAYFRGLGTAGPQPYDGSKYGGLSFWAGFDAANGAPLSIRVGLVTMDTAPMAGVCSTYCMDFHGIDVTPSAAWQRFELRFADLKQQGWGDVQAPLRRDQLVGFAVWPHHQCDLWLDDIRFEP